MPETPVPTSRRTRKESQRRVRRMSRTIATLAGAIALLLGAGIGTAWAAFRGSGSATRVASIGAVKHVTIVNVVGTAVLYPGLTTGLTLTTVTNPNPYPVSIVSIAETRGPTPMMVTGGTGCSAANSGVSVPARSYKTKTLTEGTNHIVNLTTAVTMDTSSYTGCQGATFHVPITITVKRQ